MTLQFTILGCGSSGGVPRPALGWGVCDPNNPKNRRRRTSFLAERRTADGVTRILVDTSPDLREQLLDANVDWVDAVLLHPRARRPYPRHRRPARPVHQPPQARAGLARRARLPDHARPLRLLLRLAARQRISAHRAREPHGAVQGDHGRGAGRHRSPPCPSSRSMATSPRSASASAPWPIPAT